MFTGLSLLAWIVGLVFLGFCVWFACQFCTAPVGPGVYDGELDRMDGLPRDVEAHEARFNARAERLGMPR